MKDLKPDESYPFSQDPEHDDERDYLGEEIDKAMERDEERRLNNER